MTGGALAPREAALLAARRAEVAFAARRAPEAWRRWAAAELELVPDPGGEARDDRYDAVRHPAERERLGQVFTPGAVADALVAFGRPERPGVALDPACGDGSLLRAVAERRAGLAPPGEVLDRLKGWDLDPTAVALARLTLLAWGLARAEGRAPGPLALEARDALEPGGGTADWVVANPPYLEAKRMGRAAPGLRERLRARFPDLEGAFDLYLAFAWRALELAPDGAATLLVPNRVMQGRYAARFREEVGRRGLLSGVLDLSGVRPRAFPGTGVYPVVVHLERARRVRLARATRLDEPPACAELDPDELAKVGGERPWFVPWPTWPALAPCFALPRLGEVAAVRSTVSFHARGQRERYVGRQEPASFGVPYVGGPSRARANEVVPFGLRWAGWWIRYDEDALRAEGNPLPALDLFRRPKVIFNQHDRRLTPYADREGRYATKDVYPIAWPTHPGWTLDRLLAVLASTVFTALYNTLYQGVVVGGETYHYLPAFLREVPVPPGDHPALADVGPLVADAEAGRPGAWRALDALVARAYGVSEPDRERLVEVHLTRVGAPRPWPEGAQGDDG